MNLLLSFLIALPFVIIIDYIIKILIPDLLISFLILHSIPLYFLAKDRQDLLWFVITILHGIAHIIHPAYYGTTFNIDYTPLYDFIVHAAQCLCVYVYDKELFPFGVFFHSTTLLGGIVAHLDKTFLETKFWILISAGAAVFGSQYHMMLLNKNKNNYIFICSLLIWTLPYLFYLVPFEYIPVMDSFLNSIGLFRLWYLNYFLANKLTELI